MTTSCVRCPEPATASIGVEHYCEEHHAEVLDPIRARVIHPIDLDGHGHQTGPRRPDWGPGWADLTCTTCAATWTGPIGEPCWWCEQRNRYMVAQHIETVLTPPRHRRRPHRPPPRPRRMAATDDGRPRRRAHHQRRSRTGMAERDKT